MADTDRILARIPILAATVILTKLASKICKRFIQYCAWIHPSRNLSRNETKQNPPNRDPNTIHDVKVREQLFPYLMALSEHKTDASLFTAILSKIEPMIHSKSQGDNVKIIKTISEDFKSSYKESYYGAQLVLHLLLAINQNENPIRRSDGMIPGISPDQYLLILEKKIKDGPERWTTVPKLLDWSQQSFLVADNASMGSESTDDSDEDDSLFLKNVFSGDRCLLFQTSARTDSIVTIVLEIWKEKMANESDTTQPHQKQHRKRKTFGKLLLRLIVNTFSHYPSKAQEIMAKLSLSHEGSESLMGSIWKPFVDCLCDGKGKPLAPFVTFQYPWIAKEMANSTLTNQSRSLNQTDSSLGGGKYIPFSRDSLGEQVKKDQSVEGTASCFIHQNAIKAFIVSSLFDGDGISSTLKGSKASMNMSRRDMIVSLVRGVMGNHDYASENTIYMEKADLEMKCLSFLHDVYGLICSSKDPSIAAIVSDRDVFPTAILLNIFVSTVSEYDNSKVVVFAWSMPCLRLLLGRLSESSDELGAISRRIRALSGRRSASCQNILAVRLSQMSRQIKLLKFKQGNLAIAMHQVAETLLSAIEEAERSFIV